MNSDIKISKELPSRQKDVQRVVKLSRKLSIGQGSCQAVRRVVKS